MENTHTVLLPGATTAWAKRWRIIAAGLLVVAAAVMAVAWWYLQRAPFAGSEPPPQSAALPLPPALPETAPPPLTEAIPAAVTPEISAFMANALAQLTMRISALETQLDALKNSSGETASAIDAGRVMQLDSAVRGINSSLEATQTAMTALSARLNALETVQAAQGPQGMRGDGKRIARMLGLRELERALHESGPFTLALENFNQVWENPADPAIAILRQYAAEGVPARPQLGARFDQTAAAIVRADAASGTAAGWANRAYGFVMSLVMIRPLGEREGQDAPARAARAQLRLEEGDLDAAIREVSELEGAAAQAAAPWLKDASARQAVEQALAQLNAALARQINEAAVTPPEAADPPAGTPGE